MKKTIVLIPAVFCLMLSSCGTDLEQAVPEPVGAEVAFTSQAESAYEKATAAQETSAFESTSDTECCTLQTNVETIADVDSIPSCCSPDLSLVGGCCGE